ncbi:MAG: zinc ribbon domain-containing protein [Methylococcales bacterium]|jgi:putative FmdB family regulatory protein|nr:zinc ribbon domain-containing protein [Methylococcales bacterium]MBT3506861.1 zinc ribbon domain-containing protein [Methylococcales bacterium]MBT3698891.1 zinc ribbon domain-containing protein [Methylococcales bacterium]MBT3815813.1 zinc ribbon domain-containing protein [Methylococcales bacterium]MBT4032723.1 zinc ribbon domain-containing protein [Methylococcales bacterium]
MPIYEYKCQYCGNVHDALQKMDAEPLTDCPACNESGLKKMISAAGFRLKGTGWYETDFKGKSKTEKSTAGHSASCATKSGGCGH